MTPDELTAFAAYNTSVARARAAYAADQFVAAGRCSACGRAHSRTARLCWKCQNGTPP